MEDQLPGPSTVKYLGTKYDVVFFKATPLDQPSITCLIRKHRTGRPYVGMALLSPTETNISDKMGASIALRRATEQLVLEKLRESAFASRKSKREVVRWINAFLKFISTECHDFYSLFRKQWRYTRAMEDAGGEHVANTSRKFFTKNGFIALVKTITNPTKKTPG